MDYSLIIPVQNEELYIADTLRDLDGAFRAQQRPFEIIVVDNGSIDHTAQAVLSTALDSIILLHIPVSGKGRALRAGFERAKGKIIGFTDADLSIPAHYVVSTMNAYRDIDGVCYGSRYHHQSSLDDREWWRTGSSLLFCALANVIVGTPVSDYQCPLKIMSDEGRRCLLATQENTWFMDVEFLALVYQAGIPLKAVPVPWKEHHYLGRASKLRLADTWGAILAMWRIRRRLALSQNDRTAYNQGMKWTMVGLGNPEASYGKTRHNAGRMVVEYVRTQAQGEEWRAHPAQHHERVVVTLEDTPVTLIRPSTYMNESGKALQFLTKEKSSIPALVVCYDDADLPIGSWKVSFGKGSGGHNGITSLFDTLGTRDFVRIRIGIAPMGESGVPARPTGDGALADFVLTSFRPEEREALLRVAEEVWKTLPVLLQEGREAFMLRANTAPHLRAP